MSSVTLTDDGRRVSVRIPMKMKRRGGRKMIIVPEGLADVAQPRRDCKESLARAIPDDWDKQRRKWGFEPKGDSYAQSNGTRS